MIISKKLKVLTEEEILDQVAEELGLKRSDVQRTYDIWLKHLNNIANNTSQCSIKFPKLGTMFVSSHRMRRMYTDAEKRIKDLKKSEIDKLDEYCKYNVHNLSKPIILKYGISKKNTGPYLKGEGQSRYFTLSELINKQTNAFFDEDFEFRNNEKLREYFLRKDDSEIHQIDKENQYEINNNTEIKNKEQE